MDFHRFLCAYSNVYEYNFTGRSYLEVVQNWQAKRKCIFLRFSAILVWREWQEYSSNLKCIFLNEERRNILFLSMQHTWVLQYKMSDLYILVRICGKMHNSRILSDKTRVSCAAMFLDTTQQLKCMTPPQYSNPWQLLTWNKKRKRKTLLIHTDCQSVCTTKRTEKKIQIFFFGMAINKSKDNFDIAEFSLKTFFHEILIQVGNITKKLAISTVYYSQTQTSV